MCAGLGGTVALTACTGWGVAAELEGADAAVGWWERCSESEWELCSVGVQGVCAGERPPKDFSGDGALADHPPHPTS